MKINVIGLMESVKHENETRETENATREAELTTTKTEVESEVEVYEPVEDEPSQINPDIPVAVSTTQRKLVDYNSGNLFLPVEPETSSIPKAASTDRREERTREKPHIYCFRCRHPTKHVEFPCDYEEYAANWLMYVCGVCGLKAYARKDLKEGEKQL